MYLLHLSDIHLSSRGPNPVLERWQALADAAAAAGRDSDYCLVIVSGDVAYSGSKDEYRIALKFLRQLRNRLEKSFLAVEFVIAPGNHDCDFSSEGRAREKALAKLTEEEIDESVYEAGARTQRQYWEFEGSLQKRGGLGDFPPAVDRRNVVFGELAVGVRVVNSAWMSSLEERAGSIVVPQEVIGVLQTPDAETDVVITVFHHPYGWFGPQKNEFRAAVESTSDIVLTGHEHYPHVRESETAEVRNTYIEGGVLQGHGEDEPSSFNAVVFDVGEESYEATTYEWVDGDRLYRRATTSVGRFVKNRGRFKHDFRFSSEFEVLLADAGAAYTHPRKDGLTLDDIFIYPDVKPLAASGSTRRGVWTVLAAHSRVLVFGAQFAGKTTLARRLVKDYARKDYVPLLLDGREISGRLLERPERIASAAFSRMYDCFESSWERYEQMSPETKAVVFDNFHLLRTSRQGRSQLIGWLERRFESVVLLAAEDIAVSEFMLGDEGEEICHDYYRVRLLPFGNAKRAELVSRWQMIGAESTDDDITHLQKRAVRDDNLIQQLLGKNLFPSFPGTLLIVLQGLDHQDGSSVGSQGHGAFGHLYHGLVTRAIIRAEIARDDLVTYFTYLSGLAFRLHTLGLRRLDESQFQRWHEEHCDLYQLALPLGEARSGLVRAGILHESGDSIGFRYRLKYYFFLGKYLSDNLTDEAVKEDVRRLVDELHSEDTSNIIMFLCHHSRDPYVLEILLERAKGLFPDVPEFVVEGESPIEGLPDAPPVLSLEDGDSDANRRELMAARDERESEDTALEVEFEAPEGDDLPDEIRKLLSAVKMVSILGQVLRNFYGALKGSQKLELAEEACSLALRYLSGVFGPIRDDPEAFLRELMDRIGDNSAGLTQRELAAKARKYAFMLSELIVFGTVRHVATATGLDKLAPTFGRLLDKKPDAAHRLVELSVRLEQFGEFPEARVRAIHRDYQSDVLVQRVLRDLVWHHFYLFPSERTIRERMCQLLDITLPGAIVHDGAIKELPRPESDLNKKDKRKKKSARKRARKARRKNR